MRKVFVKVPLSRILRKLQGAKHSRLARIRLIPYNYQFLKSYSFFTNGYPALTLLPYFHDDTSILPPPKKPHIVCNILLFLLLWRVTADGADQCHRRIRPVNATFLTNRGVYIHHVNNETHGKSDTSRSELNIEWTDGISGV